jgi:hypothetical protein
VFVKAAAVLAAGLVAGSVAYTGGEAGIGRDSAPARLEPRLHAAAATPQAVAPLAVSHPATPTAGGGTRLKRVELTGTANQMPVAPVTPPTGVEGVTTGVATAAADAVPIADAAAGPLAASERHRGKERRHHTEQTASQADKIVTTVTSLAPVPPLPVEPPALPLPAVPDVPPLPVVPVRALPTLPPTPTVPDVPKPPVDGPKLPDLQQIP